MTGAFLSVPKYDWCAPLSHPYSCMPMNHGPSQQSCTAHLVQRPCYQRGSLCQYPAGNRTTWRPPELRKETQIEVVQTCLPFLKSGQQYLVRPSERGKTTRQTEKRRWEDNIREWTGLEFARSQRAVENREKWRKLVVKSCVVLQRLSLLIKE